MVKSLRNGDDGLGRKLDGMGFLEANVQSVAGQEIEGYAIPTKHLLVVDPVNDRKRIDSVDGGYGLLVFDIGKAAERNGKFVAAAAGGNFVAGFFHIAIGEFETFA